MKGTGEKRLSLRCLSYRKNEKYVSVCIDLNLFAEADNFEDSKDKLFDAVMLYVEHAKEHDELELLIPRKAPYKYRLMYRTASLLTTVNKKCEEALENNYGLSRYPFPVYLNPAEGTALFG